MLANHVTDVTEYFLEGGNKSGRIVPQCTLVRVSDHIEMQVNCVDSRKIMYRFMSRYTSECRKKTLLNSLQSSFQIVPNGTSNIV